MNRQKPLQVVTDFGEDIGTGRADNWREISMKKLFYVRHGQTVMNVQGLLAGPIETPLTDEGRKQAEAAGAVLASAYPKIDLIVSSLLSSAYDTAKLIADQIDYPHEKILTNTL